MKSSRERSQESSIFKYKFWHWKETKTNIKILKKSEKARSPGDEFAYSLGNYHIQDLLFLILCHNKREYKVWIYPQKSIIEMLYSSRIT